MATREKSKRCAVCLQAIDPNCDWKQGRCPHRPPMIEIQPKDTSKGHFYVSLVKSVIRIMAGVALINSEFIIAGGLLIAAEILGIVEEIV
jgi:hypothetical protein